MQVGHGTPKIIRVKYWQENGDAGYGNCLWADFYMDPERGSLFIMSDCGNYGYRWPETGWDFIHLMEGVDAEYLLRKMCQEKKVDVRGTLERVRDALKDSEEYTERQVNRLVGDLESTLCEYYLEDVPELAGHLVTEWCNENEVDLPDAWEYVKTDYGTDEKRIVRIFVKHIQPIVRECMKNDEEGSACGKTEGWR